MLLEGQVGMGFFSQEAEVPRSLDRLPVGYVVGMRNGAGSGHDAMGWMEFQLGVSTFTTHLPFPRLCFTVLSAPQSNRVSPFS